MRLQRLTPDNQWAAGLVASLPLSWQAKLAKRWKHLRVPKARTLQAVEDARRKSNTFVREAVSVLERVRIPLDASDSTIVDQGVLQAAKCMELATVYHLFDDLHAAMERVCQFQGIEPPKLKTKPRWLDVEDGFMDLAVGMFFMRVAKVVAVARMTCPEWWRRKLRAHQGKTVEAVAIALGYVNKDEEIYCSNQTVYAKRQQKARCDSMLQNTYMVNELGQEYSLAELAAKGTANQEIRRAELMTRIGGFDRIARDCGHGGLFMTITCPSEMHRWKTVGPRSAKWAVENGKYVGTRPDEAQKYLARVWARIRSELDRQGVKLYGFRIAEPNHDGTPHWHLLVFHLLEWPGQVARAALPRIKAIVRRYALGHAEVKPPSFAWKHFYCPEDYKFKYQAKEAAKLLAASAAHKWRIGERARQNDKAAKKHRVDFEAIDWSRGSAAGYIAKYVAKNIDGYAVGEDLFGNPCIEASERVVAWAKTWRIRQFQQVGGAPVGVWRELRRIDELPAGAPEHLVKAHKAASKLNEIEGREDLAVDWRAYCEAQGGVFVGRKAVIQLDKVEQEGFTRYGEEKPKRTVGVCTDGVEYVTPEWMAHIPAAKGCMVRRVFWEVESKRHHWQVVGRRSAVHSAHRAPWTCVNNCTEGGNGSISEGGSGGKSMGQSPGARQSDGRGIHAASIGSAAGASWVELPYLGWREGDAGWLQGDELQQWKEQHMHGPWLRRPVERGAVYRIGGEFVQNGRAVGKVAVSGSVSDARRFQSA